MAFISIQTQKQRGHTHGDYDSSEDDEHILLKILLFFFEEVIVVLYPCTFVLMGATRVYTHTHTHGEPIGDNIFYFSSMVVSTLVL